MLKLRKLLPGVFPFVAALFVLVSFGSVSRLILSARSPHHFLIHRDLSPWMQGLSLVLLALSELILAMPPLVAFLYGMAWWKLRGGKPSGRGWAIAASVSMLVQAVPLYTATLYIYRYSSRGAGGLNAFLLIDLATLALAVAGLVAFLPPSAATASAVSARPPRMPGDGTSAFFDILVWVGSFIAYWFAWTWLERWGYAHGFEPARGLLVWEQIFGALLVSTALHEAGHASVAIAVGMRLRAFLVGPFQFRIRQGKWTFKFVPSRLLSSGGAVSAVPTDPNQPLWHDILMIAAGPFASLLTGAVALTAALTAEGQFYQPYWEFIGLIGLMGLLAFAVNLMPMRPEANYSDGALIYQLLSGGRWADLHRVQAITGATLITPLRPRDYDIHALERVSREFTQGGQAVWLRLLSTSCFLDRGQMDQARQANAEAEAIFQASKPELTGGLYAVLTFDTAFLRRDAMAARQWADRMTAKHSELKEFPVDYWLANAALQWSENHPEEARAALMKAEAIGQTLPAAGAYDYDRYRCALLRQAMDAQPSDEPVAVSVAG